jgi:hypothetical protein
MTNVKLTIDYRTPYQQKIISLMSKLDLGIEDIVPPPIIITFETKTKVDKKYKENLIKKFKEEFKDIIVKDIKFEIIKII